MATCGKLFSCACPLTRTAPSRHAARMIRAFTLTIGQLGDRAILKVLAKSLALTLVIFILLGIALVKLAQSLTVQYGWGADGGFAAAALAALAAIAGAWLLFRAVAIPVVSIFADQIVAAVEVRHYPQAATLAKPVGAERALMIAAGSLTRLIGINLLAVPGYILLAATAVGPAILFFAVNAVLLGRDLSEMVAARHLGRADIKPWLRATRPERAVLGVVSSVIFLIPFANLLAPIIGAGMATHLYHGRRR